MNKNHQNILLRSILKEEYTFMSLTYLVSLRINKKLKSFTFF